MSLFESIVLGIVQGLTEFLPISSSGHLVLAPYFFGWEDPGLSFNVALHFGTLLAVLAYFWRDWVLIIKNSKFKIQNYLQGDGGKISAENTFQPKKGEYPQNMLLLLAIATVPGVMAGYFLGDHAETVFRNPLLVAFTLVFFGWLLFFSDSKSSKSKSMRKISFADALTVGLAQAVAIVPGVSRSGITITAGLFRGMDRKTAARFSFLLSTPIILGASLFQAKDFFQMDIGLAQVAGIVASATSGYLAISWLIKFVERASYKVFFWYRLVLGIVIIATIFFVR